MANFSINKIRQIVRLKQVMHRWKISSGELPLEVGPNRIRFMVPARFINLPIFISLLNQARDEFGYQTTGVLSLPSFDPNLFQHILDLLNSDEKTYSRFGFDEFVKFLSVSCKGSIGNDLFEPLFPKARA